MSSWRSPRPEKDGDGLRFLQLADDGASMAMSFISIRRVRLRDPCKRVGTRDESVSLFEIVTPVFSN